MWKEWSWIRQDGKNGKTRTRASRRSMQSPVLTSPLMGTLQEYASWPVSVGQSASIFICMLHLLCQSIFIQKQYFTFLLPIWCPQGMLGRSLPVQSRKRRNSYFCHTDAGLVYDVTVQNGSTNDRGFATSKRNVKFWHTGPEIEWKTAVSEKLFLHLLFLLLFFSVNKNNSNITFSSEF